MRLRNAALSTALFLAGALTAFAAEGTFSRTLNVSASPAVTISTGAGYIHVRAGSNSEIRINAQVKSQHGWSVNGHGTDADRVREITANPPIAQNGNSITIGPPDGNDGRYHNIEIDYDITLPVSTQLKTGTGSGDIAIASVNSVLAASTGSGDVHLSNVGGAPRVSTGSGSIRADGVRGAAHLEAGSGDIELREEGSGDIKAETGSGFIRLHGVSGAVLVDTGNGDIEIDGDPTADWKVETASGSVRLGLDPHAPLHP